ncbi:MAG: glycosyltransferase [Sphingomonadales bacterium]
MDGASRNALDIARAAIAAGGAAVAAARGGALVAEFRQSGGVHLALPFDGLSPLTRWRVARRLRSAAIQHRISIIHAYGRRGSRLARRVSKATGIPFVVSPIANENHEPEQWLVPDMAAARAIVAASDFVASLVPAALPAAPRVEIIPRGVDLGRFDPGAVRPEKLVRQMQDWRAGDLSDVILIPGRVSPGKGHDVLLRAMARMANKRATLLIVSRDDDDEKFRESLMALIAALKLEGRARFVSQAPDMPAAYMLADVVAVPSRTPEAFNSTCAEALAMGRPVVATSAGGTPDIVVDGETGWLVPPADAEALARALDAALALGETERVRLGKAGRARIEERFSLTSVRERMLALYADVSARGRD